MACAISAVPSTQAMEAVVDHAADFGEESLNMMQLRGMVDKKHASLTLLEEASNDKTLDQDT